MPRMADERALQVVLSCEVWGLIVADEVEYVVIDLKREGRHHSEALGSR